MIKSNKEDYTKTKLSQDGISQMIDKDELEINTNKNSKNKIGKYLKAAPIQAREESQIKWRNQRGSVSKSEINKRVL